MPESDFILFAHAINGDGSGRPLQGDAISQMIKDQPLAWVHLDGNKHETRNWLESELTYLDGIIIDALLAEETRPRATEHENGFMIILRGVNLNDDAHPEDMVSIRLWIDKSRIISVQRRQLKAVNDIKERLLAGKGPKDSGDFISQLAARLFERMEPVFSDLDDELDTLEERVMEEPDAKDRQFLTAIRKKTILLRRYIAPQKDAIAYLRSTEQDWLEKNHIRRIQEALDRITRYVEDLDAIRERAQIVKDELANSLADRMNKNMYVLSVIAAIFLPLGFLTGLLGINVGGIPGAELDSAFLIFCAMLLSVVVIQIIIFKKMKWF